MKAIIRLFAAFVCIAAFFVPNAAAQISSGIWVDKNEIRSLPMSGPAWTSMKAAADQYCGTPDLENQDDPVNVCVMAQALVYARTGITGYAESVATALTSIVNGGAYGGRALALGRELAAYVISADLIDLKTYDPALDQAFRAKIKSLVNTVTTQGGTLIQCHENRPNNWGNHAGASRAAVAAYLGDTAQLARIAQVFKGYLGDRSSYAGFTYGADLTWQYNSSAPVGVNPTGATKSTHNIDGVLPDDQRRAGSFTWPPPKENYVWEALQGAYAEAVILQRAGYDVFSWQDRALLRAVVWLHQQADFPAANDDTWVPHLVNHFYGTSFPAPIPSRPGKNAGWTDWTHAGAASSCSYSVSPTSATLPAAGGGTQAAITTTSSCSWTARSNVSWITLNKTGGSGSGTVIASVAANTSSSSRSGTLTVAGRTFTVNEDGTSSFSTAPGSPSSPSPASGATAVSTIPTLSWTCSGASTYTVRLGTSNPPPQVASGLTATSYAPSSLSAGQTYYWQVVGVNSTGSTAGPVWSFSTGTSSTGSALPTPWTELDLGNVGLAGSAADSNGIFTVTGSGAGMAGGADAFHLVEQPLTGHSTITARLVSLQASDTQAQAGITMREGQGGVVPGSMHASLVARPDGTILFITRSATGGTTSTVATTTQARPAWLRLKRTSTTITAYVSANGSTWRTVGSITKSLTSKSVMGLAVASHSTSLRATAAFDHVSVP